MDRNRYDGKRFGRLVVIAGGYIPGRKYPKRVDAKVDVRCDCGTVKRVAIDDLKKKGSKATKSCGCLNRETAKVLAKELAKVNTQHGKSRTTEYCSWAGMFDRCLKPDHPFYSYYGARGITVAPEWRTFEGFIKDMGPKPTPKHTLERIDNDGNYEPGNCRWATRAEQMRNRRNSIMLTWQGETLCLSVWAKRLGLRYAMLWYHYHAHPELTPGELFAWCLARKTINQVP